METTQEAAAIMQVGDAGGWAGCSSGGGEKKRQILEIFWKSSQWNFWKDYKDCSVVVRGVVGSGIRRKSTWVVDLFLVLPAWNPSSKSIFLPEQGSQNANLILFLLPENLWQLSGPIAPSFIIGGLLWYGPVFILQLHFLWPYLRAIPDRPQEPEHNLLNHDSES